MSHEQKNTVDYYANASFSLKRFKLLREENKEIAASPDPVRKEFFAHQKVVRTLFQAVKPDPAITEFVSVVSCLGTIADEIRARTGPGRSGDISGVLVEAPHIGGRLR
jgi:type I restriction enzyme, R subunit